MFHFYSLFKKEQKSTKRQEPNTSAGHCVYSALWSIDWSIGRI